MMTLIYHYLYHPFHDQYRNHKYRYQNLCHHHHHHHHHHRHHFHYYHHHHHHHHHYHHYSLNDLDTQYLKKKGIKYIVFDKDQTLSDTYCDHFHPSVVNVINKLQADDTFSIAILSNSVGSNDDKNYEGYLLSD